MRSPGPQVVAVPSDDPDPIALLMVPPARHDIPTGLARAAVGSDISWMGEPVGRVRILVQAGGAAAAHAPALRESAVVAFDSAFALLEASHAPLRTPSQTMVARPTATKSCTLQPSSRGESPWRRGSGSTKGWPRMHRAGARAWASMPVVGYIREVFRIEALRSIWKDGPAVLPVVTGMDLDALERAWRAFVSQAPAASRALETVHTRGCL
jgi:hypothetical protein